MAVMYTFILMNKKKWLWLFAVFMLGVAALFAVNYIATSKVENYLRQLPKHIELNYQALSVNVLTGHIHINSPKLKVFGKTTKKLNANIEFSTVEIKGASTWGYVINKSISIDKILFEAPNIVYRYNDKIKNENYSSFWDSGINKPFSIKSLEVSDGNIKILDAANDSLMMQTKHVHFKVDDVSNTIADKSQKITYKNLKSSGEALLLSLNTFENLRVEDFSIAENTSTFHKVKLQTKYSKSTLSQKINTERDHIDLKVDSITLHHQDFGLKNDSIFHFKSNKINIYKPKLNIYRDKLVADDPSHKKLYSKMLRDLKFNLQINTVYVNEAAITYAEKVKNDAPPSLLKFPDLEATIKNFGNVYPNDSIKTSIAVKGVFMENAPLNVNWSFNVHDPNDDFTFKSEISTLPVNQLNQFMKPSLNVKLSGRIDKLFFSTYGNNNIANTDLKVMYKNLDVIALKENGTEKNKLLSTIIDIFVPKQSENEDGMYRYGMAKAVERDKTKSVFNFIWLNIKAALLNAITGNGEKKIVKSNCL